MARSHPSKAMPPPRNSRLPGKVVPRAEYTFVKFALIRSAWAILSSLRSVATAQKTKWRPVRTWYFSSFRIPTSPLYHVIAMLFSPAADRPAGWIKINDLWDPSNCGSPTTITYNVWVIAKQRISTPASQSKTGLNGSRLSDVLNQVKSKGNRRD